jgi:hypothetical protein
MTEQIFLSHSKDDNKQLNAIDATFGKSLLKTYQANFENQNIPVSQDIKKEIEKSKVMVVLLGPNAQAKEVTKIWISWEIGLMIQQGKPVWVLEDYRSKVDMPVPDLTHYLIWDIENTDHRKFLRDIMEGLYVSQTVDQLKNLAEVVGESLNRTMYHGRSPRVRRNKTKDELFDTIECPYVGNQGGDRICGQTFKLVNQELDKITCPSCRQPIRITN